MDTQLDDKLIDAAWELDLEKCKLLIEQGADVTHIRHFQRQVDFQHVMGIMAPQNFEEYYPESYLLLLFGHYLDYSNSFFREEFKQKNKKNTKKIK